MTRIAEFILTGTTFGRLTVLNAQVRTDKNLPAWLCKCDCGNEKIVLQLCLVRGSTKSCGCLRREASKIRNTTHGWTQTRAFRIWCSMKSRCNNLNATGYKNYGGRGITVCESWKDFSCFLADMGEPKAEETLDRIDNEKGYSKANCRWATNEIQRANMRTNRLLNAFGETKTVAQWARECGLNYQTLYRRIARYGWSTERAIVTGVKI